MKKKIAIALGLLLSVSTFYLSHANTPAPIQNPTEAQVRSTMMLKKYMSHFGSLVAGMEILRYKEKKPDWDAINLTLEEMDKTLEQMRQADPEGRYHEFTDVLEKNLKDIKAASQEKHKDQTYEAFDKLTGTCFACHAVHRPSDFLVPTPKSPKREKLSQSLNH